MSSLTFVVQNYGISSKITKPLCFLVLEYHYEIFQTVLSLNCKII